MATTSVVRLGLIGSSHAIVIFGKSTVYLQRFAEPDLHPLTVTRGRPAFLAIGDWPGVLKGACTDLAGRLPSSLTRRRYICPTWV